MSERNLVSWARNVFIALLLVGGMSVGSVAFAADATSTVAVQEQVFVAALAQPLQAEVRAVGGTAPYRWSLIANGLPDGVWFDESTGRLNGSPNRTGRFTFTVEVKDAERHVANGVLTLDVRLPTDPWFNQQAAQSGSMQPIIIDLDTITNEQIEFLTDVFADDAPLIYVGPNATDGILRLNIAQMRIKPHGLYRVEEGTPSRVNEAHAYSDVYYVDPGGRRHAFPTEAVFKSWYEQTPTIESVPAWKISNIPLRKNVTFRPGSVVRLENTREFYRVLPERTLRKFQDEATFQRLMTTNGIVPVLPLVNIADYAMDMRPIRSGDDLTTMPRVPTQPAEELGS